MVISKTERKILAYASVFVAVSLNVNIIFSVIDPERELVVDVPWQFTVSELFFQILVQFLLCFLVGLLNLRLPLLFKSTRFLVRLKMLSINFGLFLVIFFVGLSLQRLIFNSIPDERHYYAFYFIKLFISLGLIFILLKILHMYRAQKDKDLENERLTSAFYNAKLNNLKDQVNPHFLFNSLSSLSALIREKPTKAQNYLGHLSKVLRYSLSNDNDQIVTVNTELKLLYSNIELYKLRFENGLNITIDIVEPTNKKILHMSLQPLLENAFKHNLIDKAHPLNIRIVFDSQKVVFVNNVNARKSEEPSTGIGLLNLNERYKLLVKKEIDIESTDDYFKVTVPLI